MGSFNGILQLGIYISETRCEYNPKPNSIGLLPVDWSQSMTVHDFGGEGGLLI